MDSRAAANLVTRTLEGDDEAFGALVLHYQDRVRWFIARFVSVSADVFDIAQDVFIEAYRSLSGFDPGKDFEKWLYGITHNLVRMHLRKESRRTSRQLKALDETVRRWQTEMLEHAPAGYDNRLEVLRRCVQQLDPRQRKLVQGHYYEGLDLKTLSARLNRAAGALAMQLMRIRLSLAGCVRRGMGEEA